jgi:hypothetical protein
MRPHKVDTHADLPPPSRHHHTHFHLPFVLTSRAVK